MPRKSKKITGVRLLKPMSAPQATAVKALKAVKTLRRQVGKPELKNYDYIWGGAPFPIPNTFSGTNSLVSAVVVPAGTGENQRIGNSFTLKSMDLRWEFAGNASTSDCRIRFMVVIDKRRNWIDATGTFASVGLGDILQNSTYPMISQLNEESKGRFQILYDKIESYDSTFFAARSRKLVKRGMNLNIEYPTDASTTPTKNAIYLVAITDHPTLNAPSVAGIARFNYTD